MSVFDAHTATPEAATSADAGDRIAISRGIDGGWYVLALQDLIQAVIQALCGNQNTILDNTGSLLLPGTFSCDGTAIQSDGGGDLTVEALNANGSISSAGSLHLDSGSISSDGQGLLQTTAVFLSTSIPTFANSNPGIFAFSGDPNGALTAAKGSICVNISAGTTTSRLFINTNGGSTWAHFTASA